MTDKNTERFKLAENEANVETSRNVTKKGQDIRINKCNQCKYTSSHTGHLRTHLKTHRGEKPNKCSECNDMNTNVFGPKIKTEDEYEYIWFEN